MKNHLLLRRITACALMTALLAVCAWISVPWLVPITLQTFAVFAALFLLGGKWGTLAIGVYLVMGALGLPVFSGFRGGFGVLAGATGGYLFGFLLTGLLYWGLSHLHIPAPVCAALGLFLVYAVGTAWFVLVYLQGGKDVTVLYVLSQCVFPFVFPDAVKLAGAYLIARKIQPRLGFDTGVRKAAE